MFHPCKNKRTRKSDDILSPIDDKNLHPPQKKTEENKKYDCLNKAWTMTAVADIITWKGKSQGNSPVDEKRQVTIDSWERRYESFLIGYLNTK